MDSVDSLITKLESKGFYPTTDFLVHLFKEFRKSKIHRPDIVIKYGPTIINKVSNIELWNLVEQILIAGIDTANSDLVAHTLKMLMRKFPNSGRVGRLRGMVAESEGDFTAALIIYNEILKEQPANIQVMKRKVAVYRSTNSMEEMVSELLSIVKQFPFDSQSWVELASIYLTKGELEQAAHCYEEIILIEPNNPHFHTRLAEAYYSIGDYDHLVLARKHYASSLTMLAPNVNLRALYGLFYSCKAIISDSSVEASAKKNQTTATGVTDGAINQELLNYAIDSMDAIKEGSSPENSKLHSLAFQIV